ncbi:MAG: IS1595 family transposase [Alphaproteobacteria bacterium]|nr:IS1595 family transposase [Alphaproteobacteria bacterium]
MNLENLLKTLSKSEKSELIKLLSVENMNEHSRFENGVVCVHCGENHCIRRGVIRNNQRYFCNDCRKYFTIYAKTILNYTKKEIYTWKMFIKLMFESKHKSLKVIAEEIGISRMTSFRWRHKILDVLDKRFMNDKLRGIVEADETFILNSRKGKFIEGMIGRKRGGVSKWRGLSHEQTGILVAIDRNKNLVSKVYGCGKINRKQVKNVLSNRIKENSLLITDGCAAYRHFAFDNNLEIRQLKGGKSLGGGIHINNVNNYHSGFKKWIAMFNGISTKYLDRYLAWFKFIKQKNDCGYLFNEIILA